MIDIDHFKLYNDLYGHQMGDNCLETIGKLLKLSLHRSSDMAIRYGGEEFLIILPTTPPAGALIVAQTIGNSIKELKMEHKGSETASFVTVSMGISTLLPDKSNSLDQLIKQADKALYESKENGRNKYTFYINKK